MNKKPRTFEATLAVLALSRSNEEELEQRLAIEKKMTTPELSKKLNWTINKTNSTLYRLKEKNVVDYEYTVDRKKGKVVKEICLTPYKKFLR